MKIRTLLAVALVAACCGPVFAELQNVEIGGELRIRGNYFDFDSLGESSFIEQRTRLSVKADFTQDVTAFIELDSYDIWGEDFRSWYLCSNDFRANSVDDIEMYQAYIEARNMWGTLLSMRVGRQEIALGNQFLVGVNDKSSLFTGLSFDALRLTYGDDNFSIDAIAAKLAENFGDWGEDDVDFYTVYGSYKGIEDIVLDAYWMLLRDDEGVIGGLANGGDVHQHTVGLRGAGVVGSFDFDLEAAYQFGTVYDVRNPWFRFFNRNADVEFDEFAVNAALGYTFDVAWQPRVFANFAYLGGGDPDQSVWSNDRTMPFDRLFSNIQYSEFLDEYTGNNGALSNVFIYSLGLNVQPSEAVALKLLGSFIRADQELNRCVNDSKDLGWEVGVYGDYNYSEDLVFRAGYAHFFGRAGLETPPVRWSGLIPWQGDKDDNYHYLFIETQISF